VSPVATETIGAPPRCPGCEASQAEATVLIRGRDRLTGVPGEFAVVSCDSCGLAFTVPRLTPEDFTLYYPSSYSAYLPTGRPGARRGRSIGERVDALNREAIVRFGPYRRIWRRMPGRLLDVGCGTGDLASTFAGHGWRAYGIDPSEQAALHARAAGVDALAGTLADAPWPEGHFDAIVFNHSLEHVSDPGEDLAAAARLLRPGGLLAIAVPNFDSWHRRLFASAWFQLDLPRHLQHFDRDSLGALIERTDLHTVAVGASSMRPSLLGSLQCKLLGEMRYEGRLFRILAWALAPLLLVIDRIWDGDCLHLVAERPAAGRRAT